MATGGAKATIDPVQPVKDRFTRTLTSQKIAAVFVKETQDVDRLTAQGKPSSTRTIAVELPRASLTRRRMTWCVCVVESRRFGIHGQGPKPIELDSDLRNEVSYSRGKTATTYYSQEQTNGATPFSKVKSPVYIVSDRGEFHHATGMAIYTGNARAWQDDNFVRADKLTIYVNDKKMEANGRVQSAIYNARRRVEGANSTVPVFASAESMFYTDANRPLHYETTWISARERSGYERRCGRLSFQGIK